VLSREEYRSRQSRRFLEDNCGGSLPAFIAAFTSRGDLSRADLEEIRRMLDEYEKGV
jgi:predicted transcriptional regulator